ncbi:MAG: AraC family transcriptional regulator [Myxococcales bacterium]|nr:AraC family transcriptional regulator [Myxococcales bacterium]
MVIGTPAFRELTARVRALAPEEGDNPTQLGGLNVYRFDSPRTWFPGRSPSLATAFIVQGRKRVRIDGRVLDYDPGRYLVLTSATAFDSRVAEASAERPYLSLALHVPPDVVAETLLALRDAGGEPGDGAQDVPAGYVSTLQPPLLDAVLRLVRSLDDPIEREVLAPLAMRELVLRLLRGEHAAALRQAARGPGQAQIAEAMAYMRSHSHERLSVEALARRVAMSPSHFAHRFREVARVSPMRYLKQVRLHDARALMLARGAGAAEAAEQVGYASVSQFTRDFRSHFGEPPGRHVARLRAAPDALGA